MLLSAIVNQTRLRRENLVFTDQAEASAWMRMKPSASPMEHPKVVGERLRKCVETREGPNIQV